ncbi:glucosaminidase domain-containing protein [Lentzea sp. NPDC034063]|uniref:glucosaminidase domain-containing protein n=1 Tax=unclassified Lentzea TaxID=2643253 RepID=UPI0033F5EDA1
MKKLTATLLATAFAGLVTGTAYAAPPEAESQQENRDSALNTMVAAGLQDDYVNVAGPAAQAVQAEFRIPASVTTSQSILESDWGRSSLSANDKNYFGFKCVNASSPGPIAIGCHAYQTTECTPTCHPETAYFRVYRSMTDSFRDYGRLITTSGIYDSALPYRENNPDQFIREVAKKYATDPNYASKNISLMQNYNLYRFNTGGPSVSAGSSFSGDAKTDIAFISADGNVKVWRNGRGFAQNPWDADAIVANGFTDKNAHFADLDGDGDKEIITVLPDGQVKAWRNNGTFGANPWDADAIIATGFTNQSLHFADLDGDRKAEIITVLPDGQVKAWHNYHGFTNSPWDNEAIIASGFTNSSLHFADLNADGKAEIVTVLPDGAVKAWRNYWGFQASPWDNEAVIGSGFTNEGLHFADLDGDGKAEIVTALPDGSVKAWHNYHGFAANPWDNEVVFATGFTNANLHLI